MKELKCGLFVSAHLKIKLTTSCVHFDTLLGFQKNKTKQKIHSASNILNLMSRVAIGESKQS